MKNGIETLKSKKIKSNEKSINLIENEYHKIEFEFNKLFVIEKDILKTKAEFEKIKKNLS